MAGLQYRDGPNAVPWAPVLTERDLTEGGGADEAPPFLLETTEFVRPPAEGLRIGPSRVESLIETVQQQRPPYELLALLGLVGALVLLFVFRPAGENEVGDPLSDAAPSSAVTDPNAPSTSDGELGNLAAVPGAQVQTLPLPSTSEATPETRRTTTTAATTTTSESTTSSSVDDEESTTTTEQPTTTEPPTTVGGVQPLGNCVVETRNNTAVYAIPNDDDDNLLGRIGRDEYQAVARQDNWFLLQLGDVQGWIKQGRIRDTSGNCG